ncbi:MAG: DUF896 domain-containing protein [Christensenellales bacterium]|jgi:uncharacterized protein YnzC (UPF0291/DUF896 family)
MQIECIDRINELARIAKERPLTPEEIEERARLRKEYLRAFREGAKQVLDNTVVQYPDGTKVPLTRKDKE